VCGYIVHSTGNEMKNTIKGTEMKEGSKYIIPVIFFGIISFCFLCKVLSNYTTIENRGVFFILFVINIFIFIFIFIKMIIEMKGGIK